MKEQEHKGFPEVPYPTEGWLVLSHMVVQSSPVRLSEAVAAIDGYEFAPGTVIEVRVRNDKLMADQLIEQMDREQAEQKKPSGAV